MPDDTPKEERGALRISATGEQVHVAKPGARQRRREEGPGMRLLLVSDLTPQAHPREWDGASHVEAVDRHAFDAFMARLKPSLRLEVADRIGETHQTRTVDLAFPDLKAFRRDRIVEQVPALRALRDVSGLVSSLRGAEADVAEVRARIRALPLEESVARSIERLLESALRPTGSPTARGEARRPGRPPNPKDDALDRLLGLVGEEGSEAPGGKGGDPVAEGLVTSVLGPATDGRDRTAIDALAADLGARLEAQLTAIMQQDALGRLEAAWRGLRFLVDRIDSRAGVSLEVLPAGKDELAPAVYHQVLMPEYAASGTRAPLGACLVAQAFGRSAQDVALLQDLAETGASLQVPFIAEVGPAFFGLETMGGLAKWSMDDLRGPDYIHWQKMRREASAQYLAVALPPFHLRAEGDEPLLGSAVLATGAALSRAFAETGWTFQLGDGELEGMAVRRHQETATPLAAVLGRRKEDELADAGFVVLTAPLNADRVRVRHAPVVWQPTSGSLDVRLPDAPDLGGQLFAAQVAQGLLAFREALLKQDGAFTGIDDLTARLRDRFGMRDAPEDALQMEEVQTEEGAERLFLVRIAALDRARGETRALALHLPVPSAEGD